MKLNIPANARKIIKQLNNSGFEAYAVGGCVRDSILGLTPHDWDICTNALPDEVKEVFSNFNTFDSGIKHGTLSVVADGEVFEVTTYRIDGEYLDNRHPESVTFTRNIREDLARRDFTVNAMAYNDDGGLVDPFGGRADLQRGILRCVGNPDKRFNEDGLRILRALRFASVYGFEIEEATSASVKANAELLKNIAYERINVEFMKLICGKAAARILDDYKNVFTVFIPELKPSFGFVQNNKHHCYDVWQHILHSLESIDPEPLLRSVMLLHDIGKPSVCTTDSKGQNHFKGHQQVSADLARVILRRLKCSNEFTENCLKLIIYHDVRFDGSLRQVKRVLQKLGEENTLLLFKVQRADISAQSEYKRKEKLAAINLAEEQCREIIVKKQCFSLSQLAVNGRDLIGIGITEGKSIGLTLNTLLDAVIDGKLPNEKEALLKAAKETLKQ